MLVNNFYIITQYFHQTLINILKKNNLSGLRRLQSGQTEKSSNYKIDSDIINGASLEVAVIDDSAAVGIFYLDPQLRALKQTELKKKFAPERSAVS